jgi:tetratricopeptide (TPR) repeat protein
MNGSRNVVENQLNTKANKFLKKKSYTALIFYAPTLICIIFLFTSCQIGRKKSIHQYPYENLLTLMADCQRYISVDIYRFPYPTDLSGQNVYKNSLVRLANYERLYPGKFSEVVSFTNARLYERLGDYSQAIHYYESVISMKGKLEKSAEEHLQVTESFNEICNFTIQASTIDEYMEEYTLKIEALETLVSKCSGQNTESIALLEKEKTEVDYAIFLQDNRHLLRNGTKMALELWNHIIKKHKKSKNLHSHKINLADFHFSLAKEYATLNPPERIGFDWKIFKSLALPARNIYYQLSQADGFPEKKEARGKLEAILSFMDNIKSKNL